MDFGFRKATFFEHQHFHPRCENQKHHKNSLHSDRNGPRMILAPIPRFRSPTQLACGSLSLSLSPSLLLALG